MAAKKKLTFDEQLAQLEQLVSDMEKGGCSLEEMIKKYENGIKAVQALEKELNEAKQHITILRQNEEGKYAEEPLEATNEKL